MRLENTVLGRGRRGSWLVWLGSPVVGEGCSLDRPRDGNETWEGKLVSRSQVSIAWRHGEHGGVLRLKKSSRWKCMSLVVRFSWEAELVTKGSRSSHRLFGSSVHRN